MKSIIQNEKECYICKTTQNLHRHHCIGGTANRKMSEKYGLTVYLCAEHHRYAHNNPIVSNFLHRVAQRAYEKVHGDRSAFIADFGRDYLWEEEYPLEAEKRENDPVMRGREAQEAEG